jgi:hypothetical protein
MREVICFFIGHSWKLIQGSRNVGWMITCKRCDESIHGDY